MNVEWNRVTWYSKIVALVLFVALPFVGFWYGIRYGEALQTVRDVAAVATQAGTPQDYYADVAAWQTSERSDAGFSISYPLDFEANDAYSATLVTDWRLGADGSQLGITAFTLTIPRAFDPQTNFADAKLTVGYSANNNAVAGCLVPDQTGGPSNATSSVTVNGVPFTVFQANDAGAGNYYETTSYRTLHAGSAGPWNTRYILRRSPIILRRTICILLTARWSQACWTASSARSVLNKIP